MCEVCVFVCVWVCVCVCWPQNGSGVIRYGEPLLALPGIRTPYKEQVMTNVFLKLKVGSCDFRKQSFETAVSVTAGLININMQMFTIIQQADIE